MLQVGNKTISSMYVGNRQVKEVYKGSIKIWPTSAVSTVAASESIAGDYCFYDKSQDKLIIVPSDADLSLLPADSYTPVGVVVVPGTHDVYGDGSCGVISLVNMTGYSPDTGDTAITNVFYGQNGTDTSLTNFPVVPIANISSGQNTGSSYTGYLPSDKFSQLECTHDEGTYYYQQTNNHAPSPYLTGGSRNPSYYQATVEGSENALSDFNGVQNSSRLQANVTKQPDWKTDAAIQQYNGNGYSPAACCCWRYHTEGTNQGDWYLPACGELGYVIPRLYKLNQALTNIRDTYGDIAAPILSGLMSSTECTRIEFRQVYIGDGYVVNAEKSISLTARAFLRVK